MDNSPKQPRSNEEGPVPEQHWSIGSEVNSRDLSPAVSIRVVPGFRDRMSSVDARRIALMILDAASIAETESSFLRFCVDKLGLDMEASVGMLRALRQFRREGAYNEVLQDVHVLPDDEQDNQSTEVSGNGDEHRAGDPEQQA